MLVPTITRRILYRFSSQSPASSPHFTLLSSVQSRDLNAKLHQYTHKGTNARVYHFHNSDPQNAFASVVKTYVLNDTGCPHILQHLATCGSQKYPVRDPFFNMLRRSVNTYMNAWTGDDFTSYPFSSANAADWHNLYRVYLDMSLKASLHQLDFRQEGWRFQLNQEGKRELKGIVLNQMKGAYQDADRQLIKEINLQLFRDTPYVYDSGGKPKDIVNLQYSQLKKMYEYYYHPSNMAFYFYGNNSIENSLQYLHKEYLAKYDNQSPRYNNVNLTPSTSPQRHKTIISSTAQSNNISINYLIGLSDTLTPLDFMCIRVLSYLLLQKSNAKLYQKFIESGTAQNIGFSGFNQAKMSTFTFTLKGIFPQYTSDTFQEQFRAVLQEMVQKGIQPQRLKEFAHQYQVNLLTPRENNGIRVLQQTMNLMNHRLNFDLFLNPRSYLKQAIAKLQQPQFLTSFINKFFLQNNKMIVVRQMMAETEIAEQSIESNVQIDDKVIKEQQEQLQQRQNQKSNPNVLPMLKMEDITQTVRKEPIIVALQRNVGKLYEQYHVRIEEDINFYRLVFNFDSVDSHFLQAVTLWIHNINRIISTKNYTYNQLTAQLANHTAGFNVFHSVGQKEDFNLVFQFSCLKKNVNKAFSLLEEIISCPQFEKEHTLNAFKAFNNEATEGLTENPMNQCLSQAAGQLTRAGAMLNTYQRIKQSLSLIKEERIQDFYQFSLQLTKCNTIRLIEHSNQKSIATPILIHSLLKSKAQKLTAFEFIPRLTPKAVVYNYMVNFCAQQYKAPKHLSKQHAHINLLLELLQQDYLHPLIREKGGAYGTGARIRNNGTISLSSYLDPNTIATFEVFDKSIDELLAKDSISELNLLEAKIKQFGEVDRVKIPQNEGVSQILKGYTKEEFDGFREVLKNANFKDIVETGRMYLQNSNKSRCLFGKNCPEGFQEEKLKDFLL